MRWKVNAERTLYRDQWVTLLAVDVELPDGRQLDHRLVRSACGAGVVVIDRGRVLLIWRHRFITDTWGWEIPGGMVGAGEPPAEAAAREVEEETGWRTSRPLRLLTSTRPMPGLVASQHYIFRAHTAVYLGPPADGFESERVAWVPLADVPGLIDRDHIVDGPTLVALLYLLARGDRAKVRGSAQGQRW